MAARQELREGIAEVMSWIPAGGTDLQKVKAAHDWLAKNVSYDYDAANNGNTKWYTYNAYGALVAKNCVCSGYAAGFQAMMDLLGIPCTTVHAHNHAWNRVCVDGSWYHVDTTWDAGVRADTTYFMKSDAGIQEMDKSYSSYYKNGGEITHSEYTNIYADMSWWDGDEVAGTDTRYDASRGPTGWESGRARRGLPRTASRSSGSRKHLWGLWRTPSVRWPSWA